MSGPWVVTEYRQHPKAAPVYLLHDQSSHRTGQVATFHDRDEAESVAVLLNGSDAAYQAELRRLDPNADAF